MPTRTGSYTLADIQAKPDLALLSVQQFGEDELAAALEAERQAHNRRFLEMAGALMTPTTERIVTYGTNADSGVMQEIDELSRTPTQRQPKAYGSFNLPQRRYADALGWTRDFLAKATVQQVANQVYAIENKDIRTLYSAARKALFGATNYTVRDFTEDFADMNVKRLLNADGMTIPNNSEGDTFNAGTHTHYIPGTDWTEGNAVPAIDAAIATVEEHDHRGNIQILINKTNRSSIAALSKYRALQKEKLIYGADLTIATATEDQDAPLDNRQIGTWDDLYDIWTKPWIPAGYVFIYDTTGPKPLRLREPEEQSRRGLRFVAQIDLYPMRADYYEHFFGVGIGERTNGAVIDMGNASYTVPTGL